MGGTLGGVQDWIKPLGGHGSKMERSIVDPLGIFEAPEEEPALPPPVPEVEEVDVAEQKEYSKQKAKSRKGRRSTILGSQKMGSSNQGKKTVLG